MKKYKAICKVIIDGEFYNTYKVTTSAKDEYSAMVQVKNSFSEHEDLVNICFKEILSITEI